MIPHINLHPLIQKVHFEDITSEEHFLQVLNSKEKIVLDYFDELSVLLTRGGHL